MSEIERAWKQELRHAETEAERARAWRHLERAHVLSQSSTRRHVVSHLRMLAFALAQRDAREIVGQLLRIALAAPGTWLGRAPLGNTGGADVGLFTPMPIDPELRAILER